MGLLDAPPLSLGTADARYSRNPGFFNIGPATSRKVRKPLAAVRANVGSAKFLCVGDSTTWGAGNMAPASTWNPARSYPAFLQAALNSYYAPTVSGIVVAPSSITGSGHTTATDARLTFGTGWVLSAQGFANGSAMQSPAGVTTDLLYTHAPSADTFDIYYAKAPSTGTFGASVDGGSVTNTATAATNSIGKVTISTTAGTGHVLKITSTGAAAVFIIGIEGRLSTQNAIRVGNVGVSSARTSHWATGGGYAGTDAVKAYAPDLSIIMLGINDAAGVPTATFSANLATLATACAVSGDVILMSVVPSQSGSGASPTEEAAFQAATQSLALTAGYGYIDIFTRFESWTTANANGWMYDGKHPTHLGYADIANAVVAALRNL